MSSKLNGFDWIAPYYDTITKLIFGKSIAKAQTCHWHLTHPYSNILVLGGGTGRWLPDFIRLHSTSKLCYVDASREMICRAKGNFKHADCIRFIHGTESDIPDIKFDVIITHFYLDMFSNQQLETLIADLYDKMNHPALWIVADFEKSKWWHGLLLRTMYLFFRASNSISNNQLPDWHRIIMAREFRNIECVSLYGDFIQSRAYIK